MNANRVIRVCDATFGAVCPRQIKHVVLTHNVRLLTVDGDLRDPPFCGIPNSKSNGRAAHG